MSACSTDAALEKELQRADRTSTVPSLPLVVLAHGQAIVSGVANALLNSAAEQGERLVASAIEVLRSMAPAPTAAASAATESTDEPDELQLILQEALRLLARQVLPHFSWITDLAAYFRASTLVPSAAVDTTISDVEIEDGILRYSGSEIPQILDKDPANVRRAKAVKWLHVAAYKHNSHDAAKILGDMYLFKRFGHRRNATAAFGHYMSLASKGNATAQMLVGNMLATGVGVQRDYAKALVYMSFASLGKDPVAEQTLGYWHSAGIGMPKSCETAAWHYSRIASIGKRSDCMLLWSSSASIKLTVLVVVDQFRDGPPGGRSLKPPYRRLPNANGGVFGAGASGAGNPKTRKGASGTLSPDEILTFYRLQAETGDPLAQFLVGQMYYQGTDSAKIDYAKALQFFRAAAKQHPGANALVGQDVSIAVRQTALAASKAAGYIGTMYWRGEGVEANPELAREWFERGISQDNGASYNGLAMMYMKGTVGLEKDEAKAHKYLVEAANRDDVDGMVNLAEYLMRKLVDMRIRMPRPDLTRISILLNKAAQHGNILAYYHLGKMLLKNQGGSASCKVALNYLKNVVEHNWHDTTLDDAELAFKRGDIDTAFLHYLFAAERGYEVAQTNAAWMLDQAIYRPSSKSLLLYSPEDEIDPYATAIYLWNRAANQNNEDARVKVGDYYFYGYGTGKLHDAGDKTAAEMSVAPSRSLFERFTGISWTFENARVYPPLYEKAAAYYLVAAESEYSSIAMFNLGYMHEHGLGVAKDFHLAKRWYDTSLSTNPAGYLAVNLALAKLMLKWGISIIINPTNPLSAIFQTKKQAGAATKTTDDSATPPAPIPGADDGVAHVEIDKGENLVRDHFYTLLLLGLGIFLHFWRQRLAHQYRAEEAAQQLAREQQLANATTAAAAAMTTVVDERADQDEHQDTESLAELLGVRPIEADSDLGRNDQDTHDQTSSLLVPDAIDTAEHENVSDQDVGRVPQHDQAAQTSLAAQTTETTETTDKTETDPAVQVTETTNT
eukprot:jgi/Hompol1/6913/HPOL_002365-RA